MQESQIGAPPARPVALAADSLARLGLVAYRLRRGPKPVFETVDAGGRSLFGCDLSGKGLAALDSLIVAADRERVAACRATGQWQLVYAVQRADGSRCWVEDRFAGDNGGVGVFIDVSARVQAHLAVAERESQHQFALAAAGIGVWDADIAAGHFRLSPLARQFLGIPEGAPDPGIQHFADSLHPDDRQRVLASIDGHLRARSGFDEEFRLRTPTGGWRWFHSHGAGIGDEARWRAIGIVTDVTVRRMSDQILRDSEARLRAVLTHVSEAILTFDVDGRVRSANVAAERMFGWREHEIIGLPVTHLVPTPGPTPEAPATGVEDGSQRGLEDPSSHAHVVDLRTAPDRQVRAEVDPQPAPDRKVSRERELVPDRKAGRGRRPMTDHNMIGDWEAAYAGDDHVGHHRDGRTFAVEIALAGMLIGNTEMFTAVVRDVSASRRAAADLREAKERAEAAARAKSAFLAMMSHELRTPLNGVLGMARLLAEAALGSEQMEAVAAITQSGEALLAIVDDVLDAARIDAGRLVVRHEPFDLECVIREVGTLAAARIADRELELIVDYEPALPRQLVGDAGRVRQVLWNLVGNAIKFTEAGHVAVRVRADAGGLAIAVEDTGIGIEPAFQDRLFEAFEQADTSLTRKHGGTGLGLAISRQLVAMFGGTLSCVSQVGIGSTFRFTLPLPAADVGVDQQALAPPAKRSVVLTVPYVVAADVLERDLMALGFGVRRTSAPAASAHAMAEAKPAGAWVVDWSALDAGRLDQFRLADAIVLLPPVAQRWRQALEARGARVQLKPTSVSDLVRLLDVDAVTAAPRTLTTGRPRALVADDNHVNQRVALRLLERLGYDVDVADDGAQALSRWRHGDYAVVLMDCQMPVMDGFAATAAIRGEERSGRRAAGAHTRIVAMTANALADDVHNCLAAGMDAHVAKPVSIEILAAALGQVTVRAPAVGVGSSG